MIGREDRATVDLDACRQKAPMKRHCEEFNKLLIRARILADNSDAAKLAVVDRGYLKRFVNSCSHELHPDIMDKHPTAVPLRSHLLRGIHNLPNLQVLQTEARTYEQHVLHPLAIDSEVTDNAYWKGGAVKTSTHNYNATSSTQCISNSHTQGYGERIRRFKTNSFGKECSLELCTECHTAWFASFMRRRHPKRPYRAT